MPIIHRRWRALLASAVLAAAPLLVVPPAWAQAPVISSPEEAVAAALARSPALRGARANRGAVRGDALQAPLRPNPEASVVAENLGGIGGRGDYRGARAVEVTAGLSQRLELGGKRTARMELAARTGDVASLELEAARLDLVRDVRIALAEAEAAARNVAAETERLRQATETVRIARGRVEAGKDPELQAVRTEVTRANATVAVDRAKREAAIALRNLAVLIGVPDVTLSPRQGWFEDVGASPPSPLPADPADRVKDNPDALKLEAAIVQGRANLGLQRANGVPDVTLQGFVRRFGDGGETAFVAGASIPLPINDRNQSRIARAHAEILRAEAEADKGRLTLAASLLAAERRADLAWRSVQTLRRTAVPAADRAARLALSGFPEGKTTFLEALDAQRTASDVRVQLNDTLRDYHARRAEVDRLRGLGPTASPGDDR